MDVEMGPLVDHSTREFIDIHRGLAWISYCFQGIHCFFSRGSTVSRRLAVVNGWLSIVN